MPIIIKPQFALVNPAHPSIVSRHIERGGRLCYKSEDKTGPGSDMAMIDRLIRMGHNSVIEHWAMSIKFIVDRGCCYDDQTEILTKDGFKLFKDVSSDEVVFTLDERTGKTEYQRITKQHEYAYDGNLMCGESSMVDFAVTPNHRMFYYPYDKRKRSWRVSLAEDIYGKRVKFKRGVVGAWKGGWLPPTFPQQHSLAFAKFLGVFITDGSKAKQDDSGGKVILHQTKPQGREYIKDVLLALGWTYSEKDFGFVLYNTELYHFMHDNFTQVRHLDGRVPQWVKDAPPTYIASFMEGVIVGDGSIHHKNKHRVIYTTNKLLADDYLECLLKIGKCSTIRVDDRVGHSHIAGDLVFTNTKPCYIVSITDRTNDHLFNKKHWSLKKYLGKVYCVTVPAGIVYVRRNGKSFWSGNSHELVRQRLCSFCLSGDSTILRFNQNKDHLTIKELYDRQQDGQLRGRNKLMLLRSMNEDGKIVPNSFKQILYSGRKPTYQVNTALGYSIRTSKDHIFFTPAGEMQLKNLNVGDEVYVNGIELVKDRKWLKEQRDSNRSIQDIADEAGVSYSTVRKYIRLFGLQTPSGYKPDGFRPWNKGLTEEDDPRVKIQGDALRMHHHDNSAGEGNSCWKESDLSDSGYRLRFSKYPKVSCELCGSVDNLENHHRDKDVTNWRETNKITLCTSCHKLVHLGYNVKHVVADIITSIDYYGEEDTYDIEMSEPFHNFVAEGFVVHNSQESTRFCTYSRNKFGNAATFIDPVFWENDPEMYGLWLNSMKEAEAAYMRMISRGATAQEARSVLPNSLKTEIMVTANMRQWRLVFSQRCANAAHPQIRQAMLPALAEVSRRYPILFKDIHEEMKPEYELFKKNNWSLAQKLDDEIDFPEEVFVALGNDNSNIA